MSELWIWIKAHKAISIAAGVGVALLIYLFVKSRQQANAGQNVGTPGQTGPGEQFYIALLQTEDESTRPIQIPPKKDVDKKDIDHIPVSPPVVHPPGPGPKPPGPGPRPGPPPKQPGPKPPKPKPPLPQPGPKPPSLTTYTLFSPQQLTPQMSFGANSVLTWQGFVPGEFQDEYKYTLKSSWSASQIAQAVPGVQVQQ